jgi:cellulose synthase/poly-beta-1,6-N-acetylglucosamine synthase-like glycosyltransferase
MTWVFRAVVAFLLLKLSTLAVNLIQFPVLKAGASRRSVDQQTLPTVSLLVPVRNEAANLARTLPALLAQRGVTEVVLLDDQSTDGSAELAAALMDGFPLARMVSGTPPPPGWVGKNWACQQLGSQARGQRLVYCDADVLLADGAIEAVVAQLSNQDADVFSVFPRQLTGSLGEALVTPLIDDVLLCFLPFGLLSVDAAAAAATANGSLIAFTRTAYDKVGGFASVHDQIVEDVALARRARRIGLHLGLALGGDVVRTRMYSGYREVVTGLSRGLLPVTGGFRSLLVAAAAWHIVVYTVPLVASARRRRWLLPLALGMAERGLVAAKCDRAAMGQAVLTPLSPLAFLPLAAQAMRRQQHWKGRTYQ